MWTAVLLGAAGCYLFKLAGLSIPDRVLAGERIRQLAALLPVALLTALIVIQTFTSGPRLVLDPRAAGLLAAGVAVLLRAPFLLVVAVGAATAAVLRALT
jgi:branched-subunit amino acid transport protein